MHARSGAFHLATDKLDEAITAFRDDHLPNYQQQDGYKGFTLMVNRETGQVIGISFWESESDLRGSDQLGTQAREDINERGGGQSGIERADWEVVIDDTQ